MSWPPPLLLALADALLLVHLGVVLFVIGGLLVVPWGARAGWRFVRSPWFRGAHLAAIGFVALQAWLGEVCPLTVWENALRDAAGSGARYEAGFIEHWVGTVLYHDLPAWAFTLAYTAFLLAVLAAWWRWPPRATGGASHEAPRAR